MLNSTIGVCILLQTVRASDVCKMMNMSRKSNSRFPRHDVFTSSVLLLTLLTTLGVHYNISFPPCSAVQSYPFMTAIEEFSAIASTTANSGPKLVMQYLKLTFIYRTCATISSSLYFFNPLFSWTIYLVNFLKILLLRSRVGYNGASTVFETD